MRPIDSILRLFSLALIPWVLLAAAPDLHAREPAVLESTPVIYPLSSLYYPVVLSGRQLPSLLELPIGQVALYASRQGKLAPIPFQIDRKDRRGRFEIAADEQERREENQHPFDENDECVFMVADAGEGLAALPDMPDVSGATEIVLTDPTTQETLFVYALVFPDEAPRKSSRDYVTYHIGNDTVETETYRVAFSQDKPFLLTAINWKEAETQRYARDYTDTMKVRHRGKLFHQFDFLRTEDDYKSRVIGVKDGPVRVIRRTLNRVRVLWKLRTPTIAVDYIHYANAFFMDTRLNPRFKPGLFFSDLETLMTVDSRPGPSLPDTRVYTETAGESALFDGKMTDREHQINLNGGRALIVSNHYGKILTTLEIEEGSPIDARPYFMDDVNSPDPPENVPGQFGNVGFISSGWDKLDTSVHHLVFTVYMIRNISVEAGFRTLRQAPSFLH